MDHYCMQNSKTLNGQYNNDMQKERCRILLNYYHGTKKKISRPA